MSFRRWVGGRLPVCAAASFTLIACGYDASPKEHGLETGGKADGIEQVRYLEGDWGTPLFPHRSIESLRSRTIHEASELNDLEVEQAQIAMGEVGIEYGSVETALAQGVYLAIEDIRVNRDRFVYVIAMPPVEGRGGSRPESGAYFRAGTTELVTSVDSESNYTHYTTMAGAPATPSQDCLAAASAAVNAIEAQRPEAERGMARDFNLAFADDGGELIRLQAYSGNEYGGVTRAVYFVATARRNGECIAVGIQDQAAPVDMSRTQDETSLSYTDYECVRAAEAQYAALRLGATREQGLPPLWGHELLAQNGANQYVRFYDLGEHNPMIFSFVYETAAAGCVVRGAVTESYAQRLIDD